MEKVIFLRKVPLFSELNSEILIAIGEIAEEKELAGQTTIFQENEFGDSLYIIVSGEIEIVKQQMTESKSLGLLHQTEFFGEMSIFDDKPRSATATARKNSILLAIRKTQFRDLISEYPEIMFEMYKVAIQRLRQTNINTVQKESY